MTEPRFGRLLTAMVTPFTATGELDLPRAQELALRLLDQGSEALVVCGTTGESPTVYYDDKMRLFEAVLKAVDGSAPVIANAGDDGAESTTASRIDGSAGVGSGDLWVSTTSVKVGSPATTDAFTIELPAS